LCPSKIEAERWMTVSRIDHVQLAMPPSGEKAARDFYEGLLGVPEVPKPSQLAARGGCWFECRAVKIHVGIQTFLPPERLTRPLSLTISRA
jgi:catechol 2,3-dioxygenase-like lactoylglutathione lyase family enzyme